MLMRFDPFRDFDRLTRASGQDQGGTRQLPMPMDAYRDGDRFVVCFDLPGVDPSSIDVTVEKNVLTVKAQRQWPPNERQEVLIAERPQGTFVRQLFLGESLDTERLEATYDQGVLKLTLPVAEQAKPRKVEIHSGSGSRAAIEAEAKEASPKVSSAA
jgi:HSP20 family protein